MITIRKERKQTISILCLLVYLFVVLWYTVLKRPTGHYVAQFELFWSYKEWIVGDVELGKEIVANIAMFIPLGFLLASFLHNRHYIILAAVLFSIIIEFCQLILMCGLFEWDDVISNTLGAIIGLGLRKFLEFRLSTVRLTDISFIIALFCGIISLYVYCIGQNSGEVDTTSRAYCFQIKEVVIDDNELVLTGFAFQYDQPDRKYTLVLRSLEDGQKVNMALCRVECKEASDYFDVSPTNIGFKADGFIDPANEYEVMIKWPWAVSISTGVYVSSSGIHYMPEKAFESPELNTEFVNNGVLRLYRPEQHCWIYQYENTLYWIADQGFYFEDDSSTYIQYQLHTTQPQKLPQDRLDHNWLWDNIGGNFEDYELHGEFGSYRIMKREIPTTYPVTAIVTGYYKNGAWTWKEYFRPIYEFE